MEEKNKNIILKTAIIFVVLILLFLIYDFTPIMKAPIGNIMFGYNQCTLEIQKNSSNNTEKEGVFSIMDFDDKHSGVAGDAVSTWKCKLC